jgi:hypothetical protein
MSVISIRNRERTGSFTERIGAILSAENAMAAAGIFVFISYAILAIAHMNDRYQVNFVSGVYAALAQRLNDGVFYPDLTDGATYGGTRYMPLSFALHAGFARLTGEYLVSGKLLAYALTLALCGQIFVILRWLGCGRGAAIGLTSLVLVNQPGFLASTTIRGDLLPVVAQIAAIMIVWRTTSFRGMVLAALLCALAFFTKFTSVWAVPAIALTCLPVEKRRLGMAFLAAWLGALTAGFVACQLLSEGRMMTNFQALAGSGLGVRALLRSPNAFLAVFGHGGVVTGLVVPVLAVGCYRAIVRGSWTIFHSSAICAALILLVIFADMRTVYNHALDLVVLAILVAGRLWVDRSPIKIVAAGPQFALAVIVCWAALAGWVSTMENRIREVADRSWTGATGSYPRVPLVGVLPEKGEFLSEDPWVEIARGRKPTLLDPDSFARLTQSRPQLTEPLLQRVRDGDFTRIILLNRVDSPPKDDYRWQDVNLGWPLVRAIEARYELVCEADGYFVYAPRVSGS